MSIEKKLIEIEKLFKDGYSLHSIDAAVYVDIKNDEIRTLNFRKDNLEQINITLNNLKERFSAKPLISKYAPTFKNLILEDTIVNQLNKK